MPSEGSVTAQPEEPEEPVVHGRRFSGLTKSESEFINLFMDFIAYLQEQAKLGIEDWIAEDSPILFEFWIYLGTVHNGGGGGSISSTSSVSGTSSKTAPFGGLKVSESAGSE
ncbi:hypothetical protein N7470_003823 [Penicillium chermesinum]|nr:hypothetical protein N7470_003823 [Penicillium chermesinum]